jgi:acetyl-CoA carboxylase biotin carboxyl carrier protein
LPVAPEAFAPAAAPAPQPATVSAPPAKAEPARPDAQINIIKSPIVGTFYRSPSPNSESFVKVGDHVEPDTVVCIIEAMKLMNEIQAETTGEIVQILVQNGQPVEFGQPLFGIKI